MITEENGEFSLVQHPIIISLFFRPLYYGDNIFGSFWKVDNIMWLDCLYISTWILKGELHCSNKGDRHTTWNNFNGDIFEIFRGFLEQGDIWPNMVEGTIICAKLYRLFIELKARILLVGVWHIDQS